MAVDAAGLACVRTTVRGSINVYICDRFVIPALTQDQMRGIGQGGLLLDQMTRDFIRRHLSYRFVIYPSGAEALAAERDVRAGQSSACHPYLNPL